MFGPKVLEEVKSKVSGLIEVRQLGGSVYVATGGLTQSGGLIHELWSKTFNTIPRSELIGKRWLILGLATGTVAQIIAQKYAPVEMTGVEIDPAMLEIGQKYFSLGQIPGLKITTADANKYVTQTSAHFDWVLVDTYVGEELPRFVYSVKFLQNIKRLSSKAIFNHLFYDTGKKARAELLVNRLKKQFDSIRLHRELTNLLIICG